jgi:hypothetical protein
MVESRHVSRDDSDIGATQEVAGNAMPPVSLKHPRLRCSGLRAGDHCVARAQRVSLRARHSSAGGLPHWNWPLNQRWGLRAGGPPQSLVPGLADCDAGLHYVDSVKCLVKVRPQIVHILQAHADANQGGRHTPGFPPIPRLDQ